MIWAEFSQRIKTSLAFVQETLDSVANQNKQNDHLLQFLNTDSIFQQDNAPCHVSRSTLSWLQNHNVRHLNWLSLSPGLNPIENLWGSMARTVYENGKSYDNVKELKKIKCSCMEHNTTEANS